MNELFGTIRLRSGKLDVIDIYSRLRYWTSLLCETLCLELQLNPRADFIIEGPLSEIFGRSIVLQLSNISFLGERPYEPVGPS